MGGRLADLHSFDTETQIWTHLASPPEDMPGRGGAGFVASSDGKSLFVVGGFVGSESNQVFRFDIEPRKWHTVLQEGNDKIKPFSVSCGITFPLSATSKEGRLLFFGGEVEAS